MTRSNIAINIASHIKYKNSIPLTKEEYYFLTEELNIENDEDRQNIAHSIYQSLIYYFEEHSWVDFEMSAGEEKRRVKKLIDQFSNTYNAITNLGPRMKSNDEWGPLAITMVVLLEQGTNLLSNLDSETFPGSGRPRRPARERLMAGLVMLWKREKKQWPGVSNQPISSDPIVGDKVNGPFVRFCMNILMVIDDVETEKVIKEIRNAVKEMKIDMKERSEGSKKTY